MARPQASSTAISPFNSLTQARGRTQPAHTTTRAALARTRSHTNCCCCWEKNQPLLARAPTFFATARRSAHINRAAPRYTDAVLISYLIERNVVCGTRCAQPACMCICISIWAPDKYLGNRAFVCMCDACLLRAAAREGWPA
jgi:hypothetical protein